MEKIHSKLKALEWLQYLSHYKSIGIFQNAQGQVTHKPLVGSYWISNLLIACKNEEDPIKNEWASGHNIINYFLRCSRGINSKTWDGILTKFKLIQALIVALIVCKNEEDPLKIERARVVTTFLQLYV